MMTYFLTALSNDRARLIHKEAQTTCATTADMIEAAWRAEGYIVNRTVEN
jgi:hypothetical protein